MEKISLKMYTDVKNFGDLLGLAICKKLAPHATFQILPPYSDTNQDNLISIGSIIKGADTHSTIWGAGFIEKNEYLSNKPKSILAVRGPLTNLKIQKQGLAAAKVLGDPGHLCGLLFPDQISTRYQYGVIPHYVDKKSRALSSCKQRDDVLLIDVQQQPEQVLAQIKSCHYILSSSLHGIICADAYGIPAIHITLSNKVYGQGFKFRDYYLACGREEQPPYVITKNIDFNKAHKQFKNFKNKINANALLDCFPY